jgi:cbb3-type cytochrome oxidase maturation protein
VSVLYIILPLALLVAGGAVLAFTWVVRSGQLDDVDTPPRRMLCDDDSTEPPTGAHSDPRTPAAPANLASPR